MATGDEIAQAFHPMNIGTKKVKKLNKSDVIKSVCECKVCGKPFGDKLSLYEHYDEEHNKQTDL